MSITTRLRATARQVVLRVTLTIIAQRIEIDEELVQSMSFPDLGEEAEEPLKLFD